MAVQAAPPSNRTPEEQWPAIPLAYDLAVKSTTDLMLKRFEIHENRVRSLITLTASLTFGAPVFARAARGDVLSYSSPLLFAALSCAVFILILGTLAFVGGRVAVINPKLIHAGALDPECKRPWDFQHWMLAETTEAFKRNNKRLDRKGYASDTIAVVLLLELVCMGAWIISA